MVMCLLRSWPTLAIVLYLVLTVVRSGSVHQADTEDNEFAEFEDFEDEDVQVAKEEASDRRDDERANVAATSHTADEVTVEDEDDDDDDDVEFEHFQDEEEFEGFEQGKPTVKGQAKTADIKIAKVPIHFRANWDSFYLEMLMIAGLFVYFLNFVAGKTKNQKIANAWFTSHKQLLNRNFHLVGDSGKSSEEDSNQNLLKESENVYMLWCSGRSGCEGMLVEILLLKRQDLVHIIMQMLRPASDQVVIKVNVNPDDMDTFVFAIATKKSAAKLSKEMADIGAFCSEKKSVDRYGIPTSFIMYNELSEVPLTLLDSNVSSIISQNEALVNYIHFSDQYTGPKLPEDTQVTKVPDAKKVLIFSFNMPGNGHTTPEAMESMTPLLQLVFYCMDKVRRYKLGKEAKQKAEKTRSRIEGEYLKMTHQQRVEAAQQRREEKRRAEKERIMNEEDPEKQRKWEEREHKRELKKRAPKMKQLKVKAL